MIWMDLTIKTPEKSVWGANIRKILAKQNNKEPEERWQIPWEIFHYDKSNEKYFQTPSPFRFEGSKHNGAFHLYAIGDDAVDMLNQHGHKITRLLGKHFGTPLLEQRYTNQFDLSRPNLPFLLTYGSSMIVFEKNKLTKQMEKDAKANNITPEILAIIEKRIRLSLRKQYAHFLNFDIDELSYTISDVSCKYVTPVTVEVDPGVCFLAAANVRFRCSLDLRKGPWHVGYLRGRGYGKIFHVKEADNNAKSK